MRFGKMRAGRKNNQQKIFNQLWFWLDGILISKKFYLELLKTIIGQQFRRDGILFRHFGNA
jgi:hypothetical protein